MYSVVITLSAGDKKTFRVVRSCSPRNNLPVLLFPSATCLTENITLHAVVNDLILWADLSIRDVIHWFNLNFFFLLISLNMLCFFSFSCFLCCFFLGTITIHWVYQYGLQTLFPSNFSKHNKLDLWIWPNKFNKAWVQPKLKRNLAALDQIDRTEQMQSTSWITSISIDLIYKRKVKI